MSANKISQEISSIIPAEARGKHMFVGERADLIAVDAGARTRIRHMQDDVDVRSK